jgi:hypothetical protein
MFSREKPEEFMAATPYQNIGLFRRDTMSFDDSR